MPTAIAMPKLGMTMREGTVLEWRARTGEGVERGEIALVIESEKAEVEIEAPASGVLRHVYVAPGATVPCATVLAAITDTADEPFDAEAFRAATEPPTLRAAAAAPARREAAASATAAAGPLAAGGRERVPITPAARRRAKELGVDPARVAGSGPGGRVIEDDVVALAERLRARVSVADGVALDVPTAGAGETVLLLPGFGADATAFARQTPALAPRHLVRVVHARGVALSDAPDEAVYAVATAASDVAAVAGGAGAHVVGASLGAAVAIELALTRPGCVRSLALVTPFVRAEGRLLAVLDAWCRLAAEASREALAAAIVPWLFSPALLADDARRALAMRGFAEAAARIPAGTLRRAAAGLRAWSGTREADLGKLRVPVLVIAGADDLLTPRGPELSRAIPGAHCVVVPGGHAVALESADAVNEALRDHLARS